jgi:peroxiredoxin Q/BCP
MNVLAKIGLAACLLGVSGLVGARALAADGKDLKVGDKAPSFTATDDQGKEWKSADHVGKKIVVVYFYPADFTGGCTAQACGFRDNIKAINDKDVEVVGVSGDSAKTHAMFRKEHKLPFTLLADEDGAVAKKFGVPANKGGTIKHKTEDGETVQLTRGVTIARWTVVIGTDGNIAARYKVGNPGQDNKKVLETVQKLSK